MEKEITKLQAENEELRNTINALEELEVKVDDRITIAKHKVDELNNTLNELQKRLDQTRAYHADVVRSTESPQNNDLFKVFDEARITQF